MELIYEGVDITEKADVVQCVHDMYAEQHGDTLCLKLKNEHQLWDRWNPMAGDCIEVKHGHARTGKMYITKVLPSSGYFTLHAGSLPPSMQAVHSESWEKITEIQLATDIAMRHGLQLKLYGITDQRYEFLRQSSRRDMDFLEEICVLEGDAFLVYDGKLILYNEEYIENARPTVKFKLDGRNRFCYERENKYTGCTIWSGSMKHVYGMDGQMAEHMIPLYIASSAQAERYAKNLLRYLNKQSEKGYFYKKPIVQEITAGSVIDIQTQAAGSFDGKVFMTHVRHDYKNGESKLFFRKVD